MALLDEAQQKTPVPLSFWWNQPILVLNGLKATRKTTVLGAANKDGGAHVDLKLTPEYEQIISATWISMSYQDGEPIIHDQARNAHYAALRQMAFEVLSSPSIKGIAGAA